MPPGPLPNPKRRRRNAPVIPTTELPAGGRRGPVPRVPKWLVLAGAGRAWWAWAWRTPQAAGWSEGDVVTVAHRASLEDDLAALAKVDGNGLAKDEDGDLFLLLGNLAALVGGRLGLLRECRELDGRLGLTPKGLADLRWKIVADVVAEVEVAGSDDHDDLAERRRRIGA